MTDGEQGRHKLSKWLRIALGIFAVLVLLLVVPPLVSVSHFKGRITRLISQSLGRQVRLSSAEVHLLPWPGFDLNDLSVAEDPAYGAEPVLHANKVTASIRLLSLLRGRIEIGKISVDEASLNLVRTAPGQWNLDPLFRNAAAQTGDPPQTGAVRPVRFPSLEATDSRIDFKNGVEKLPFSLVNADLSLWQESPGEWRIRLRGQPARTDVSLYLEDTGEVRMEASVRRASALREMPVHLDLDWRRAQLGQLARLLTGSDPGWRGDLAGNLHVDGSADAAQVTMQLRAVGVHRAEFAPVSPLDFDANCAFVYHYTFRSVQNLDCNSPLGDGRLKVTGEKLGVDAPPQFTVELDRIPAAAGLDALRTFRSGLDPDLEVAGQVSGKIVYAAIASPTDQPAKPSKPIRGHTPKPDAVVRGPLTGSLSVVGLALSGGGLTRPLQASKMTLGPLAGAMGEAITGTVAVPAGGTAPLTFALRFSLAGYQVGVRGQASYLRARELAHAAGIPGAEALEGLAGDPIAMDLTATGPWIPPEEIPLSSALPAAAAEAGNQKPAGDAAPTAASFAPRVTAPPATPPGPTTTDTVIGTVTVHNANWKGDYLANHVEIADATLRLDPGGLRWDPVDFTYGPVTGTATVTVPAACPAQTQPGACAPQFAMQFGGLDAAGLETALLGAKEKGTLLSDLIERFHPSASSPWPNIEGTVSVDSFDLGPVTLDDVLAAVKINPTGAEITSLDADILGGKVHVTGAIDKPATDSGKPDYSFEGQFDKLSATDVGALLGMRWAGGAFDAAGKVELTGYTDTDLESSAKGTLHIEWRNGAMGNQPSESSDASLVPAALGRFDSWTADADIAAGAITIKQSDVKSGAHKRTVGATVTFGDPPTVSFNAPKDVAAKRK
jgi:hypothetical protein